MDDQPVSGDRGWKLDSDRFPRTAGLVVLVVGLFFGFIGFYFPFHDASQGAQTITVHSKAVFMSVLLTTFGLVLFVLGPIAVRIVYRIAGLRGWRQKAALAGIFAPFVLAAVIVTHLFEKYLESFGYKF